MPRTLNRLNARQVKSLETIETIAAILNADDPPAYCEGLARPWNTAFDGDRIRLDNPESEFRPS